jgi:hypothetical protein
MINEEDHKAIEIIKKIGILLYITDNNYLY